MAQYLLQLLHAAAIAAAGAASLPVPDAGGGPPSDARRELGGGGGEHLSISPRVIRGDDATPHVYNWVVALFYSNGAGGMFFTCGGIAWSQTGKRLGSC